MRACETSDDAPGGRVLLLTALGRDVEALSLVRNEEDNIALLLAREGGAHHSLLRWIMISLRAFLEGKREESLEALENTMKWRRGEELFQAVRQMSRLREHDRAIPLFRTRRGVRLPLSSANDSRSLARPVVG